MIGYKRIKKRGRKKNYSHSPATIRKIRKAMKGNSNAKKRRK